MPKHVALRLIGASLLAGLIVPASSALATSSGQPVRGSIGIRLVDAPVSRNPLARLYVMGVLMPGTFTARRIEITNGTTATATIAVYPAAAALRHGTFRFAAGHTPNELSRWTSVSRRVLRLPPGTKVLETVAVNVPRNASAGERYAVVWAETSTPPKTGETVKLVNRVGVRMYVSVGPGGAQRADFTVGNLRARRSSAGPFVVARVHNTGRRTLAINGTLNLSHGPSGLRAGPFRAKLETLLAPGKSQSVTVRLSKGLPRGPWRAQMRLRSGSLHRATNGTITFPKRYAALAPQGGSSGLSRLILVGVVLLLLASLATLAALWYRRATSVTIGAGTPA